MHTIRSFIAIPLKPPILRAAAKLVERLSEDKDGIKWVPSDNLHLTLKFLGDVDNVEVPKICDVIAQVCDPIEQFEILFTGIGGMPTAERPRVICSTVDDETQSLKRLVCQLEIRLADLGFKPEPREYVPHLTLGRTRGGSRFASEAVISRLEKVKTNQFGLMRVDSVQLIASFLEKRGPSYQVMATVEL